jgi:adenylyl- and sulfurtransferase ThiI
MVAKRGEIVLDMFLITAYNTCIKSTLTKFFGRKNMTEVKRTPNYTDEMVEQMVADYQDNPTKDTVAVLARQFQKTTRSIVAKLVREGVYVAQPRTTKTGAPVVRKSEIVADIQTELGATAGLPSLEKASKADLQNLLALIQAR